ncbi:MAG: hypothetical protein ACON5D_15860 [Rubripirellula sp.]
MLSDLTSRSLTKFKLDNWGDRELISTASKGKIRMHRSFHQQSADGDERDGDGGPNLWTHASEYYS